MSDTPLIYWFRQDLRLSDLPGLRAAVDTGRPLILCYLLDTTSAGEWSPGRASQWWLHHSLVALNTDISARGNTLIVRSGDTLTELQTLARETGADLIHCSRAYEP